MKIGIFLAYAPFVELSSEGLGRHLIGLVGGLIENDNIEVTILNPSWSEKSVKALFRDAGISSDKLKFRNPSGIPVAVTLLDFFRNKKFEVSIFKKIAAKYSAVIQYIKRIGVSVFANIGSWRNLYSVVFVGVLILPVFLLAAVFGVVCLVFLLALKVIRNASKAITGNIFQSPLLIIRSSLGFLTNYRGLVNFLFARRVFEILLSKETDLMAKIANGDDCDIWFSPTAFWPEISKINGPVLVCVPDLSPTDFPIAYAKKYPYVLDVVEKCLKTVRSQQFFVTYSNHVAVHELIEKRNISESNVFVVPHAPSSLNRHIDIRGTLDDSVARRKFSNSLIDSHRIVNFQNDLYLKNFSFEDVRYIFYPTQIRPNKNFMNLLRAYETLLRRRHRYLKLFITGDISVDSEISNFIKSKRLEYEVISFRNIPDQVLAALYHRAELVVNTSLFEGGFPFTFAEGLSVDTPSVQADVPHAREFLPSDLSDKMLFNPYDPENIADVICRALDGRSLLLSEQKKLLDKFENTDWAFVGSRYISVFEAIINKRH